MSETADLSEAAELLKVSSSTLLRRARAGIVPGTRMGRRWVFVRADLIDIIRQNYKRPCSIAAQGLRTGTSDSRSTAEKSASQLAQAIARKRKNSKRVLELVPGGKSD